MWINDTSNNVNSSYVNFTVSVADTECQTLSTANSVYTLTNDVTSNLVSEVANKHNAKTIEVEVGEINVVNKMDELNAPIGGEGSSSGGIIPPSRCRDGIL